MSLEIEEALTNCKFNYKKTSLNARLHIVRPTHTTVRPSEKGTLPIVES